MPLLLAVAATAALALLSARGWSVLFYPALLCNGLALAAYAVDKIRAQTLGVRVPESALHVLSVAGGCGAALGRWGFRHKTRHASFTVSTAAGTALLWLVWLLTA